MVLNTGPRIGNPTPLEFLYFKRQNFNNIFVIVGFCCDLCPLTSSSNYGVKQKQLIFGSRFPRFCQLWLGEQNKNQSSLGLIARILDTQIQQKAIFCTSDFNGVLS